MFLSETIFWLIEHGWLMLLHLSAKTSFPKPLPPEEERRLIAEMAAGSDEARRKLIEHNLRLVAHIAKKYARSGVEADDLVSVGAIGLMKAVQTFRPEAGKLTAYASRCIENEMRMALRANRKNRNVVQLDSAATVDKEGREMPIIDLLGTDPDLVSDAAETAIEAKRALALMEKTLQKREMEVVRMRYGLIAGEPRPQHEVAKALGISRSYVSRIEKKALEKLRNALESPSSGRDKC